jgi:hypothetical protein
MPATTDQFDAFADAGQTSEVAELAPLSVLDRCDSPNCSAQAYLRSQLKSGLDLVFCGHHGHELMSTLAGQGAVIRDDTELLSEDRLSSSSN